ncbi:hypothetical protein [uncultured Sphingomonas sp.]|uniref:hypothetical protein n=1 Tax=uncultured Sphingomonas sp. TaxID=158754 RepID=UPI0035CB2668
MGRLLVRQPDDATITRLKIIVRDRKTSVEALARQAISDIAQLTIDETFDCHADAHDYQSRARSRCIADVRRRSHRRRSSQTIDEAPMMTPALELASEYDDAIMTAPISRWRKRRMAN